MANLLNVSQVYFPRGPEFRYHKVRQLRGNTTTKSTLKTSKVN